MTYRKKSRSRLQLRSSPLVTRAVAGAGAMLVLAGAAVGISHLVSATRRWVKDMEVPPSELARQKWAKAKAAAAAGTAGRQDQAQVRAAP